MEIIGVFESITFLGIVKFLICVLLGVYGVFSMLMMKQIQAMTRAVQMRDDFMIRILGLLNFVFAIVVLILALVIL